MDDLSITSDASGRQWAVSKMLPSLCEVESCLKAQGDRRVYLIADSAGGKKYVLKTSPAEDLPRLMREYELLFKLHDDAFAHPIACGLDGERAIFVREYVPGATLAALVEAEGALGARRAVDIVIKVCAAIGTLQSLTPPFIHRDIKPPNVLLREDGSICLIDLDAAEACAPEKPFDTVLMGTATTAAPEQFGYRRCDERTDVYAIGMLLVYLTTGGYDAAALGPRHVPRSLQRIILRCLEFDPNRRPDSAKRLGALFSNWKQRRVQRVRSALCAAAVLAVALMIGLNGETLTQYFDSLAVVAGEPVYEFASPLIEKAVRLQLGKSRGGLTLRDLEGVTQLNLCAETAYIDWDNIASFGVVQFVSGVPHTEYARLQDLSDLKNMPNLRKLSLNRLGIEDISEISRLPLTYLALGSNGIRDITPLGQMDSLTNLDISNNPIYNLDALENCTRLEWLNLSAVPVLDLKALKKLPIRSLMIYDMLPAFEGSALADMASLKEFCSRYLSATGFRALCKLAGLEYVGIFACEAKDLTPFSGMTGLSGLMLSHGRLENIDGVSAFDHLTELDVSNNYELKSIEPLRGNGTVKHLKISNTALTDLSVLETMPNLTEVICTRDQQPLFDALTGDRSFTITVEN